MRIDAHAPEPTFNPQTGLPVRYNVSDDAGRTWVVRRCLDNCTVEIATSPLAAGLDDFICSKDGVFRAVRSHWAVTYDPARTRHGRPKSDAQVSVQMERERQDAKWGEQNLDPFAWIAVLTEEVGEFAQEALRNRFGDGANWKLMRAEAVQVAAVALAIVECLDRDKWRWPKSEGATPSS